MSFSSTSGTAAGSLDFVVLAGASGLDLTTAADGVAGSGVVGAGAGAGARAGVGAGAGAGAGGEGGASGLCAPSLLLMSETPGLRRTIGACVDASRPEVAGGTTCPKLEVVIGTTFSGCFDIAGATSTLTGGVVSDGSDFAVIPFGATSLVDDSARA